ncbi:MAG: hypothetical protein ABI612_21595 [Betaproteobacteria bacterium]
MEAPLSTGLDLELDPLNALAPAGFTGTSIPPDLLPQPLPSDEDWKRAIAHRARNTNGENATVHTDISFDKERSAGERIFDAIQSLYLSHTPPRDRRIAERITALYRDALAEDETMRADSLAQFAAFFLKNPGLGLPKITLTPEGTLRARWICAPEDFVAIEFTGQALAKAVAEIPRDGETARYFFSEPLRTMVHSAYAIGASFA